MPGIPSPAARGAAPAPMKLLTELRWPLGKDFAQLRYTEDEQEFHIDLVLVPVAHRGQGIGARLMHRVLLLADHLEKDVRLSARIIAGGASEERLQRLLRFYARFGFEPLDRGVSMVNLVRRKRLAENQLI